MVEAGVCKMLWLKRRSIWTGVPETQLHAARGLEGNINLQWQAQNRKARDGKRVERLARTQVIDAGGMTVALALRTDHMAIPHGR